MKYLIASDIHGSYADLKVLLKRYEDEQAQKLILLGDIYYHGARNSLPNGYDPKIVAQLLNDIKEQLIVIKGNCDSEVDQMVSDFDFVRDCVISVGEKVVYLTHGHIYNKDNLPKTQIDCLIYGHLHTGFIEKYDIVCANAGSISLPKNNTPKSYLILEDDVITLKTLEGHTILSARF